MLKKKDLPIPNNYVALLLLIFAYSSVTFYMNNISPFRDLYIDSLRDNLSNVQINIVSERMKLYSWIGYVFIPVIILFRIFLVSVVLYIGVVLSGIKLSFNQLFKTSLLASFLFIIPLIIQVFWIEIYSEGLTLQQMQFFSPFSLLSFFDPKSIDPIWVYPLQAINVFEIVYWFALAYGIYKYTEVKYENSFFLVIKSYLPALMLWIIFVMFLTVTFST